MNIFFPVIYVGNRPDRYFRFCFHERVGIVTLFDFFGGCFFLQHHGRSQIGEDLLQGHRPSLWRLWPGRKGENESYIPAPVEVG